MNLNPSIDWDDSYRRGEFPWDLGKPHPELSDLFHEKILCPGQRVLVPGAGRGWDALYLAESGCEVTALDLSSTAIHSMRQEAKRMNLRRADLEILEKNFFDLEDDSDRFGVFDRVLEHTFFCALPETQWKAYSRLMKKLLSSEGLLVGIFFQKDPLGREVVEGPPFPTSLEQLKEVFGGEFSVEFQDLSQPLPKRENAEILGILRPH